MRKIFLGCISAIFLVGLVACAPSYTYSDCVTQFKEQAVGLGYSLEGMDYSKFSYNENLMFYPEEKMIVALSSSDNKIYSAKAYLDSQKDGMVFYQNENSDEVMTSGLVMDYPATNAFADILDDLNTIEACKQYVAVFKKDTNITAAELAEKTKPKAYSFGDTFTFDDLEITFIDSIEWTNVQNQFSDKNGADVFKVKIKVKNISTETHGLNMFYYSVFGTKGTKLETVSAYFDGNIDFAGEMRSGAEMESFIPIIYDGDGNYYIVFNNYSQEVEVELPIVKN